MVQLLGNVTMSDGSAVSYDALPNTDFRLYFPKATWLTMFLQEFVVPEVSVDEATRSSPYVDFNEIGEKMKYGDITCRFIVDKNLKNYKEIFNWMRRMTVAGSIVGETENLVLIVNGIEMIRFTEAWPLSLSDLRFAADESDVTYITASVTFNFDYFEFIDSPFHVTNP